MGWTNGGMRVVLHGGLALALVVLLAASWPAFASTGIAWAPPEARGWLDPLLVFVPLLWAPLPACLVWWVVEAGPQIQLKEAPGPGR